MKFSVKREVLLKPLQAVIGAVERRQTMPILANVLMNVERNALSITGTDLEIELIGQIPLDKDSIIKQTGQVTVPARKLLDICRTLPDDAILDFSLDNNKCCIRSRDSRFVLSTLPATDFPSVEPEAAAVEFTVPQQNLHALIARTQFAMAQQDVRYYLNGMLLELNQGMIRCVATDGHRLATCSIEASTINTKFSQVILPRKGCVELLHLFTQPDAELQVFVGDTQIRIIGPDFTFTSKLIDGRFPDYNRVIPKGGDKVITVNRQSLHQALSCVAVLSNEKYRSVRFQLRTGSLRLITSNPEQEQGEEVIKIDYTGEDLDIGFNVTYLLDILSVIDTENVQMTLSDSRGSVLIEEDEGQGNSLYVVMPMWL